MRPFDIVLTLLENRSCLPQKTSFVGLLRGLTGLREPTWKTLSDADLLVRSVPGTNHIAWQLGHVIGGTRKMLAAIGRAAPAIPDGFEAAYTRDTSASDDPVKFATKAEYVSLMDQMKAASLAAVDATPEGDLDKPGPEPMRATPRRWFRAHAFGHALADARRPVRADPPQTGQAAAVLRAAAQCPLSRNLFLRNDLPSAEIALPSAGRNR